MQIIREGEDSTASFSITQAEKEAIQEQVIAKAAATERPSDEEDVIQSVVGSAEIVSPQPITVTLPTRRSQYPRTQLKEISKEELIAELRKQQEFYLRRPNGFVGLKRFVQFYLPDLGSDEHSGKDVLQELINSRVVEVHYVPNPYNPAQQTAALRLAGFAP